MAWNDPSNKGDDKDLWTGKKREPAPPDLSEIFKNIQRKLAGLFGGSGGKYQGSGSVKNINVGIVVGVIGIIWLLSGIFIVNPAQKAVILRFGKYAGSAGPGPHWIPRFIESYQIVNEQIIRNYSFDAEMLTKDTNIVSIKVAVQYRIANAKDALFQVVRAPESLEQATASAMRQVMGHTTLDAILTIDKENIQREVKKIIVQTLERYKAGVLITDVAIQEAKAPDAVREAFEDVNKAQEDEKRFINQAQAYAKQIEPNARGQAQRLLADADAYKQQVVLHAKGDIARFLALLPEYQRQPEVTKERLYLDTIEAVLMNTSKILVDVNGSNNMMYLPLDKIIDRPLATKSTASAVNNPSPSTAPASSSASEASRQAPTLERRGGY